MIAASRTQVITYFIGICLLSISLLVFVNASASFVVTDILGQRHNIGNAVGTLGFADELVAIFACPLWGLISDQIGPRTVVLLGYAIIAIALSLFVNARNVIPELLLMRMLFSIGASAVSTMVTAILPLMENRREVIAQDHSSSPRPCEQVDDSDSAAPSPDAMGNLPSFAGASRTSDKSTPQSFGIAGLVGTAAGCGALLAVFVFLRIPPYLQQYHYRAGEALCVTFYLVSATSLIISVLCFFGLGNIDQRFKRKDYSIRSITTYFTAAAEAMRVVIRNDAILLAYLGGFVARASSVGISLFIPLWVNSYYITSGQCQIEDPSQTKDVCAEAYKVASIWTGISQLAALLLAPVWGFASARYRLRRLPLLLTAVCGGVGYLALCLIEDPRLSGGFSATAVIIVSILIGAGQIGAIVCSLGLLSIEIVQDATSNDIHSRTIAHAPSPTHLIDDIDSVSDSSAVNNATEGISSAETDSLIRSGSDVIDLHDARGLIAGLYSFAGGLGILILTKLGGHTFDQLSKSSPFIMLAGFNILLLLASVVGLWRNNV